MGLGQNITKERIFDKYSDYDIYSMYIPDFTIDAPMLSPFRNENRPSFHVFTGDNGELIYKDFGYSGEGSGGNALKFVMTLYNLNWKDALDKIWKDLESGEVEPIDRSNIKIQPKKESTIVVTSKPFGKAEKSYWDSFGVKDTSGILNPDQIWIGNKEFFPMRNKYGVCFVYEYWNEGLPYFKVYRPFAMGREKWPINSVKNFMLTGEIKPRKKVIITKSLKDFKVLQTFTSDVIGFQNENVSCFIPEIMEKILAVTEEVYIFLDNDRAGHETSAILAEKWPLKQIFTDDKYLPLNDPAGVRQKYGREPIEKLLEKFGFIN